MALDPKLTKFSTASPVLVSFDQVDIANGTGYEDYFLIESEDDSGTDDQQDRQSVADRLQDDRTVHARSSTALSE